MKFPRWMYCIGFLAFFCITPQAPVVYLIGDSTMASYRTEDNPLRGWGQVWHEFFNASVRIHNRALSGRSTKSFIDEGHWQSIVDSLQSGQYVFIQFGHNDEKIYDSTRYADPHGAYKANLERFISDTRAKGAQPVLLTPIVRRRFDEQGKFVDSHGEYPDVVRETAREQQTPLIDLHASSRALVEQYGVERSKEIYLWLKPGEYAQYPDGKSDDTHFCEHGARLIACLAAQELKQLDLELKEYLIQGKEKCY